MDWFDLLTTRVVKRGYARHLSCKYKGDSTDADVGPLLRKHAWALIMTATCFAQRYTQAILVSNTAGVAPGTDPQLRNHSEQPHSV